MTFLQALDQWALSAAWNAWGHPVSWLELIAFVLALGCVIGNIRQSLWGWPLAIASCFLYAHLFAHHRLFGDAGVQVFFAVMSAWAWWQWLVGKRDAQHVLSPIRLERKQRVGVALAWLAMWPVISLLLMRFTSSDVPWFDGFLTAGSVIGQVLLGRKYLENWGVWMVVNLGSIALFAMKGLMLTMVLYTIFLVCAVIGYRTWRKAC